MAVKAPKTEVAGHQVAASPERTDGGFFPTVWLIASYLVLAIAFFLPVLLPGRMIFGTDYLAISYPFEELVTRWFGAGELPQWIPYVYGGVPFFANPMDIYNPVTLVLRLLHVPTYMHLPWIFITHFFLAGTGMYLLMRELGARRFAAYLAGLAFMFSGYLISFVHGGHEGRAIVAALAPLFLFVLHRAIRTGGLRWFIVGGAVLGSVLLSNQIQSAYYLLIAAGVWSLFSLWRLGKLRVPRALAGRLAGGALILAIGFAMAAVNFLPFLGYVDASPRGGEGRGYEYATSWAMPPTEITGLAVPERVGILQAYWGENYPIKFHTEYAGAFALLLLVVGAYLLRRNPYFWFFVGIGVLALTFSFGGHTPIYRLYYELLPGTAKFRAPSISFFLLTVSVAAIAGLALDRLAELRAQLTARAAAARKEAETEFGNVLRIGAAALAVALIWGLAVAAAPAPATPAGQPTTLEQLRATQAAMNHPTYVAGVWRFLLFLTLSAGGLWLWLRGTLSPKIAAVLLGLVVVADLWIIDKKFLDHVPAPAVSFAPDQIAEFLSRRERPFRVFVGPGLPQDDYLNLFGIELVGGEHGNQLQSYNEFLGAGERTYTDLHNLSNPKFLALVNARYFVWSQPIEAPGLRQVFEGRTRNGRTAFVYEYLQALPRAFVVPTASQAEPPEGALARMHEQDFDPTREVVLYEQPPMVRDGTPRLDDAAASVVRHEPTEVVVEVTTPDSAYLVLTDNYYPDWHAEVDGSPADIYRAYHTFRAVPVPPGTSTVAFRFESSALQAGFTISVAVWIALLAYGVGLGIVELRRRRSALEQKR